jgi:lipoprotein-releasing system permease protein
MFNTFERAVAGRYLRARRGERFVSVIAVFSLIGIALGVATLIIVMSVMGGFKVDLLSRILGFNGHLGVYGAAGPLTDFDALAAQIRAVPGVTAAIPVVDGQVLVTDHSGASAGGYVRGIRQADLRKLTSVSSHIVDGSLDRFQGDDAIAIGVGLARRFNVRAGGSITLVSPQGAATAFGTIPRVRAYTVAAVFQVGMNEYDTSYVFLPLEAARCAARSMRRWRERRCR